MTTLHEAAQQALEALRKAMQGNLDFDEALASYEAMRSALAPQPELSTASKSEQLLASHDHALRAEFQRMKAALAQQGEQQPVQSTLFDCDIQPRPLAHQLRDYHLAPSEGPLNYTWQDKPHRLLYDLIAAVKYYAAAPAAQPTCKQDLQVPTVKENLTVETEQERYVRMCPDIECGRKKRCTRMVGVSCMSRADIAPAAQPCVHDWGFDSEHSDGSSALFTCQLCGATCENNAPTPQPDARKVIEQMVDALKKARSFEEGGTDLARVALAAGQKLLKELK